MRQPGSDSHVCTSAVPGLMERAWGQSYMTQSAPTSYPPRWSPRGALNVLGTSGRASRHACLFLSALRMREGTWLPPIATLPASHLAWWDERVSALILYSTKGQT